MLRLSGFQASVFDLLGKAVRADLLLVRATPESGISSTARCFPSYAKNSSTRTLSRGISSSQVQLKTILASFGLKDWPLRDSKAGARLQIDEIAVHSEAIWTVAFAWGFPFLHDRCQQLASIRVWPFSDLAFGLFLVLLCSSVTGNTASALAPDPPDPPDPCALTVGMCCVMACAV